MSDENDEFIRLLAASTWNQARAARELGITSATVSRYVSGDVKPSRPVLRLFAQRIGEPLLTDHRGASDPNVINDGPRWLENWEQDVLTTLRKLAPQPRRSLITALRDMVDSMSHHRELNRPRRREPTSDDIVATTVAALIATDTAPESTETPGGVAPAQSVSEVRSHDSTSPPRRRASRPPRDR